MPEIGELIKGNKSHAQAKIIGYETNWFSPDEVKDYKNFSTKPSKVLISDDSPVEIGNSVKMSKSKRNVVDPIDIIEQYGADTARWFVMSDSPPERDVEWTNSGIEAAWRHLQRVWRLTAEIASDSIEIKNQESNSQEANLLKKICHKTIRDVTDGINDFSFNKAIAKLYELTNILSKSKAPKNAKTEALKILAVLMQPMTPHLSEQIFSALGIKTLAVDAAWPVADESLLKEDLLILPIQVNGKKKSQIEISASLDNFSIENLALNEPIVKKFLKGAKPKKIIVVPGRIINVVI